MSKKLTGKVLAKFEATRDVWQEVLENIRKIKAGGGKRTRIEAQVVRPLYTIHHEIALCPQFQDNMRKREFGSILGVFP